MGEPRAETCGSFFDAFCPAAGPHTFQQGGKCMKREIWGMALAILGAVIGAGFASGRELMSFFARFGDWSWLGIVCAAGTVMWVVNGVLRRTASDGMPDGWRGRAWATVWRGMFLALSVVLAGAMLAGSGEIAALMLPWRWARWLGMGVTLLLAAVLARGRMGALGMISGGLVACLAAVMVMALKLPRGSAASLDGAGDGLAAIWRGVCYGGFNAALAVPVMGGRGWARRKRIGCAALAAGMLAALLALGNALMLRHPELAGEALPMVALLRSWGMAGYRLCGATMYLAVLTSLLAAVRGLTVISGGGWRWVLCLLAALGVALGGFRAAVDAVYPALGAGCLMLLMAAAAGERRVGRAS